MGTYKVEITGINTSQLKTLSHEENIELFKKMKNGDQFAKESLVNGNLKLVLSILRSFNKPGVNMDDLFQVGVVGLIKAIDNFDISYNLKLSTYGVPLIIGEIKKYLRDNTDLRVSRSTKDLAYRIIKFKEDYINMHGKEASTLDITNALNISEYEVMNALSALNKPMSIFEPIYNDGGDTIYLEDQIADKKNQNIDHDMIISMNRAFKKISDREKDILTSRFVIGKTQSEIADKLDISQAQVSRIEKNALVKMRRLIK